MDNFVFNGKQKMYTLLPLMVGVLCLIIGLVTEDINGQRVWSNLLVDGFFFFAIALAATFFLAVQYAAESGWSTVLKRIMESFGSFMPIGAVVLLIVFAAGSFGHLHHIYHWMDPEAVAEDALLQHKEPFLNNGMFYGLTILFLGGYILYWFAQRKLSMKEDEVGGTEIHFKNVRNSAIFLVFFGFTSMVFSWLWLMSIDAHWFSTIYGWYIFSGFWVSSLTLMTLVTLWLKELGYLPNVNRNHFQNMGKWMFAISFLWSYLWFAQFMLIWYSDIPEEVTYYLARWEDYQGIFMTMFFANFALPMLLLMDADNKASKGVLIVAGIIIFVFHWIDTILLVFPGALKAEGSIGFFEFGMMFCFLGVFLFWIFNHLTKAPLEVKNHPFLEESVHHHA